MRRPFEAFTTTHFPAPGWKAGVAFVFESHNMTVYSFSNNDTPAYLMRPTFDTDFAPLGILP